MGFFIDKLGNIGLFVLSLIAWMAELADASDSKSDDFTVVWVRPPLQVPNAR